MSEYAIFGLVFFGCLIAVITICGLISAIDESIKKRKIKQARRIDRRIKRTADYAEFVAIASTAKN